MFFLICSSVSSLFLLMSRNYLDIFPKLSFKCTASFLNKFRIKNRQFLQIYMHFYKSLHLLSLVRSLLIHVDFTALIKAFKFIIFNPPSAYRFTTIFFLIFAFLFHKKIVESFIYLVTIRRIWVW